MDNEELELLRGTIEKSGGINKWRELLAAWRRSCRSHDRAGIADMVRRSAKTEEGAVQLAVFVLLGLSLSEDAYSRGESTCGGQMFFTPADPSLVPPAPLR